MDAEAGLLVGQRSPRQSMTTYQSAKSWRKGKERASGYLKCFYLDIQVLLIP